MATLGEGLPCDVAQVFAVHCWSCHGAVVTGGAPFPLTTREHLARTVLGNTSVTLADRSVSRMLDMTRPMPPGGALVPMAQIDALRSYIDAGLPASQCQLDAGSGGSCDSCDSIVDRAATCTLPSFFIPNLCKPMPGQTFFQCLTSKCGAACAVARPGTPPPACMASNEGACRMCATSSCGAEVAACR
jgi:hypothetical protein